MRDQNDNPVQVDFGYNPPRLMDNRRSYDCIAISRDQRNCFVGARSEVLMRGIEYGWDVYTVQRSFLNSYATLYEGVM